MQVSILAGGEAGQGIQTVGLVLSTTLSRGGLHVFSDQEYQSRIKGGHSLFRVRAADHPIGAPTVKIDILIALNKETIDLHRAKMAPEGTVICDKETLKIEQADPALVHVPLEKLALETAADKFVANTVAIGAALGLLRYDFELLAIVLKQLLAKAGNDIVEKNIRAARAGFDFTRDNPRGRSLPAGSSLGQMLLNGNEALSLGAMAAGMRFLAGYPMTPTTSILEFVNEKATDQGIVVVQSEDEISAINMVVGASYAGARAMTATSGSGFCLMTEGLGLAGITETPAVVVLGQRPGPAVGLPTNTEQGELLFACFAGTGEFPRAVLAPATIEDCFHAAVRAFNLADKYQTVVIILTDHVLATSYETVGKFDLTKVTIDRGSLFSEKDTSVDSYKRHSVTESGVSPRAFPLQGRALVVTDSDEHNEEGHLDEDSGNRTAQVAKRLRKMDSLGKEVASPRAGMVDGATTTVIGWGSTYGATREAVSMLRDEGKAVNHLHMDQVWPFPADAVASALGKTKYSCVVENNATGQMARLIRMQTGIEVSCGINKYDGRPFVPEEIVAAIKGRVG